MNKESSDHHLLDTYASLKQHQKPDEDSLSNYSDEIPSETFKQSLIKRLIKKNSLLKRSKQTHSHHSIKSNPTNNPPTQLYTSKIKNPAKLNRFIKPCAILPPQPEQQILKSLLENPNSCATMYILNPLLISEVNRPVLFGLKYYDSDCVLLTSTNYCIF